MVTLITFFQFLVSYEPLEAYFYISAQGICAILAFFSSLKDQSFKLLIT